MIEAFENIVLSRKGREFKACVSLVQGSLDELSLYLRRLHPKETMKYRSLQYDRRKLSYLLGRFSAKRALMNLKGMARWESIWIDSGVFDFPVVRCPTLQNTHVSISHCGPMGVSIAFEEAHPMGIDLEKMDSKHSHAMQSQLTNKESALLKDVCLDSILGYTILWSVKESLTKVIKTGMMMDFSLVEVDKIVVGQRVFTSTFVHFGQYKTISCPCEDHVISITLPKKSEVDHHQIEYLLNILNI